MEVRDLRQFPVRCELRVPIVEKSPQESVLSNSGLHLRGDFLREGVLCLFP